MAVVFPLFVVLAYFSTRNALSEPSIIYNSTLTGPTLPQVQGYSNSTLQQQTGQLFPTPQPQLFGLSSYNLPTLNVVAILLVLAAVLIGLIAWRGLRTGKSSLRPFDASGELAAENRGRVAAILDETIARLDAGSPYRETVIKCYKMVSELLEERSDVNGKVLTAREFRDLVSKKLEVDSPYLSELTSLFEVARYSQNEVTREQSEAAIACLTSLSELLKQPVLVVGEGR